MSTYKTGTLAFGDNAMSDTHNVSSTFDSTYNVGGTTDVPLGDFLARPVEIERFTWDVGSNLTESFRPWDLFFNQTQIKARIEGFRHVRGNLKIRAVVTGNPFLFARAIMAYEPFSDRSVMNIGNPVQRAFRGCLSHMPHVYLDAATSQGGEMTLPFFSPYNWIDTTKDDAFTELGKMYVNGFQVLRHANASSGSMEIVIYAWMEDAVIATPTAGDYDLVTYQSGEEDEHKTGLISKTASNVAAAAGLLGTVPWLAPFAMPTAAAAGMVSQIAHIFGYSRPRVLDNICPMRELRGGEMASTNQHEVMPKLAWDARNELSIDPRTVGLDGTDEMAISYIASKEAYIGTLFWNESQTGGDVLGKIVVSPMYGLVDSSVTPSRTAIPPVTAVARMFKYWRGPMVYRLSVVCSTMHRGKLLIQYDPVSDEPANTNQIYSRIIDLSETRDFEIPIHWHSPQAYLKCREIDYGNPAGFLGWYDTSSSLPAAPETSNGRLRVTVLTPLTSPDPSLTQSINILLFAKGGEGLEFAGTQSNPTRLTYKSSNAIIEPQGIDENEVWEYQSMEPDAQINPLASDQIDEMGTTPLPDLDHTDKVFMGETVQSVRAILRRYYFTGAISVPNIATTVPYSIRRPVITTADMPRTEYIMNWYAGWRGAFRMRCFTSSRGMIASLISQEGVAAPMTNNYNGVQVNTEVVEAESPFYYNKRFAMTRTSPQWADDTDTDPDTPNRLQFRFGAMDAGSTTGFPFLATGEDFSLFFFVCIPPVYLAV
jgi:hypothetical protein